MPLLSISLFLHRHLLWFLIAAYVIAVVLPVPGLWIRNVSFGEITILQQKTNTLQGLGEQLAAEKTAA